MLDILNGNNAFGVIVHRKQITSVDDLLQSNMFKQIKAEIAKITEVDDKFDLTNELTKALFVNLKDKTALQNRYFENQSFIQVLTEIF